MTAQQEPAAPDALDRLEALVADDAPAPIYLRLAARIADGVLDGRYPERSLLPSTNEFAARLGINPATVARAFTVLVQERVAVKRRGIGMMVADGAVDRILGSRRSAFLRRHIRPLVSEARQLRIPLPEVTRMIERAWNGGTSVAGRDDRPLVVDGAPGAAPV